MITTRLLSAAPSLSALRLSSVFISVGLKPNQKSFVGLLRPGSHRTFQTASTAWGSRSSSQAQFPYTRALLAIGAIGAGGFLADSFLNQPAAVQNGINSDRLSKPFVREYLNDTFKYVGAALVGTAASAYALHSNYPFRRAMARNPVSMAIGGLVITVVSMLGTYYTDPSNVFTKHAFFAALAISEGAMLSPLLFLNPAILSRAALYTTAIVGSLSWVAATSKSDQFLYMGGPLFAGLCVVAVSSLATWVIPASSAALTVAHSISLYGGLVVFGGFVLYDTQKVIRHGELAERGIVKRDPINESISLYLDFLNIFIRMVQILQGGSSKKH